MKHTHILMDSTSLDNSIQQLASQCVKCGLCLPSCPTYAVTENECESPRGRITLLNALAQRQLSLSAKTQLYLDHCLTCRACEAVCPANVQYGELIDKGRQFITEQFPAASKSALPKLLDYAIRHPRLWRWLAILLFFYQRSGLQYLLRKSLVLKIMRLARLEALLPARITLPQWRAYYPPKTNELGQVALFTGCVNQLLDQVTIRAAIKVLTACGYRVFVPAAQRCCGALHQHAGLNAQARESAELNIRVFNSLNINKIITLATGCTTTLLEYNQILNSTAVPAFSPKVIDINQFLISISWPAHLTIKSLAKRAAIHTPCTLRNVLKQSAAPLQLLNKIPALEIIPFPNTYCCGAAGQNVLQHPTMADTLLEQTLQHVVALNIDYLITTNIGCLLHLQKGLAEKGCKTRILHPVVLLASLLHFRYTCY